MWHFHDLVSNILRLIVSVSQEVVFKTSAIKGYL